MKKGALVFLTIFLLGNWFSVFAQESQKTHETTIQILAPVEKNFLTISEAKKLIRERYFLQPNQSPRMLQNFFLFLQTENNTLTNNPLVLDKNFAIFLILQDLGITLVPSDDRYLQNNLYDVKTTSFFANYINFSENIGLISWDKNNNFFGEEAITPEEFGSILDKVFREKNREIFEAYEDIQQKKANDEENITLNSASKEENSTFTQLSFIQNLVKNIINYKKTSLYSFKEQPIFTHQNSENQIGFSNIFNFWEYNLFFDYDNFPFLAKNFTEISHQEISEKMIKKINNYRKENNLSPVKNNETLDTIAQKYAKKMYETGIFSHLDEDGNRVGKRSMQWWYDYAIVLENIAYGYDNLDEVFDAWTESSSHDDNLKNKQVDEVGVGFYGKYWVQVFGKQMQHESESTK